MNSISSFLFCFSLLIAALSVASLGLIADLENKLMLSDLSAAFGLVGSILSMFAGGLGCTIFIQNQKGSSVLGKSFVFLVLLSQFFLMGYASILIGVFDNSSGFFPEELLGSMGVSIATSALWIFNILIAHWTGLLGNRSVSNDGYDRVINEKSNLRDIESQPPMHSSSHNQTSRISMIFSTLLFVIAAVCLGLSAASKAGEGSTCIGAFCVSLETSDVVSGFSITGAALLFIAGLSGSLAPCFNFNQSNFASFWLIPSLIGYWLLVGSSGIWCEAFFEYSNWPELWTADFSLEVITSVFAMITIVICGEF